MGFAAHCDCLFFRVPDGLGVLHTHTQKQVFPTMQPSVSVEQSLLSLRSTHPLPATTARALSPLPDQLSLADTPAAEAMILMPTNNTAGPQGAGTFVPVDESTNQRLSAVNTAPPQAGDCDDDQ